MINKRSNQADTNVTVQSKQLSLELGDYGGKPRLAPMIISHILPAKPTVVFDSYWRFAAERQKIFFNKLENAQIPWTDERILSTYKFTNAYRASDRTSQYLIRNVIYRMTFLLQATKYSLGL